MEDEPCTSMESKSEKQLPAPRGGLMWTNKGPNVDQCMALWCKQKNVVKSHILKHHLPKM